MTKIHSKKISMFSFAVAALFALPFTGMAQTATDNNSSTTMDQNQTTSFTSSNTSSTSNTSTTSGASSTKIMLMKHLCNANITNNAQFEALGAGTTTLGRFIAEEVACPTTALPGDAATAGTISGPRTNFDFRVLSGGTEQGLNGATYTPRSLCETDANTDMNNDGVISATTCLDAAHYDFDLGNMSSGTVRITENVSPDNNHMAALRFTPQELMPNTDSLSLVSLDATNSVINLNPAADNDRMIMLHIFNIQTGTSSTPGTGTSTTTTGTGTTTTGTTGTTTTTGTGTTTTGTTTGTGTTTTGTGNNGTGQPQSNDVQVQRLERLISRLLSLLSTMGVNITNVNIVNILNGTDDGNQPFMMSGNGMGNGNGGNGQGNGGGYGQGNGQGNGQGWNNDQSNNDQSNNGGHHAHHWWWDHHSTDDSANTSLTSQDDNSSASGDDQSDDDQSSDDQSDSHDSGSSTHNMNNGQQANQ